MTKPRRTNAQTVFPPGFLFGAGLFSVFREPNFAPGAARKKAPPGPARIKAGTAAQSADPGENLAREIDLARKFGLNALQITLPWACLQPAQNTFEAPLFTQFAQALARLAELNIEPVICLADAGAPPPWFARNGGWRNPANARAFLDYARRAAETLAEWCRLWVPIEGANAPLRAAATDPAIASPWAAADLCARVREADSAAAGALRAVRREMRLGAQADLCACAPRDKRSAWDLRAARRLEKKLRARSREADFDFVALSLDNVYEVHFSLARPASSFAAATPRFDMLRNEDDAREAAAFLGAALHEYEKETLPVYITACGFPCADDAARWCFLAGALGETARALQGGAPLRGFFFRTLCDDPAMLARGLGRSGLVHVDTASGAYTPNPSAFAYGEVAQRGDFSAALRKRFGLGKAGESRP